MQLALDFGVPSPLESVRTRLLGHFGPTPPHPAQPLDPLSQMVRSMLGCRTLDQVSWPAFERLRDWCGGWETLLDAEPSAVAAVISDVQYPDDKARRLLKALAIIKARQGGLDLDVLAGLPVEQALRWLKLPGVGPKVAAATLNFSTLRQRVFVVDTHVWRVSKRLGLIGPRLGAGPAHRRLLHQTPAAWNANDLCELHRLMKRLGQEVCTHWHPRCWACPLDDICPWSGYADRRPHSRRQPSQAVLGAWS